MIIVPILKVGKDQFLLSTVAQYILLGISPSWSRKWSTQASLDARKPGPLTELPVWLPAQSFVGGLPHNSGGTGKTSFSDKQHLVGGSLSH
jgi:hypothetical protein